MESIFKTEYRVLPSEEFSHIKFSFMLNKDYSSLVVKTSYSPKYEEDEEKCLGLMREAVKNQTPYLELNDNDLINNLPLANHIGWSIDSPSGYIGTKHMHNENQVHYISEDSSSSGFFKCKVEKGLWQITASINSIVTNYIDIVIEVEAE